MKNDELIDHLKNNNEQQLDHLENALPIIKKLLVLLLED